MSWSLKLRHGDLTLSGASLAMVTNEEKLAQDLRCWILEKMGTDSLHPSFGSLIDGGVRLDGRVELGVIGTEPDTALAMIESELHRIVSEYQAQQLARAKGDRFSYNKSTLSLREALLALTNIEATMVGDNLNIVMSIQTANGLNLGLTFLIPA